MIEIAGDLEEGGGQILRTSLALSAHTGKPFRIQRIRARRSPPGLKAQHLAGVRLVEQLAQARVEGAHPGSTELTFIPTRKSSGSHRIDVGTAGSVTLLVQAALLPSLTSLEAVELELIGGTDVAWAPPVDYLARVLLPYYHCLGEVELTLERRGFHPKGGGRLRLQIQGQPCSLPPLLLEEPQSLIWHGSSVASHDLAQRRVAERQAEAARELLPGLEVDSSYDRTGSTGSVLTLWAEAESAPWPLRVGADHLGRKGLSAEEVGRKTASLLKQRLSRPQPVEEHLADNLIPFLGLFGGRIACQQVTPHTRGNAYVVEQFLPVRFEFSEHEVACAPF